MTTPTPNPDQKQNERELREQIYLCLPLCGGEEYKTCTPEHPSVTCNRSIDKILQLIEAELVKARNTAAVNVLNWVLSNFILPNEDDAKVFRLGVEGKIRQLQSPAQEEKENEA